MRLGHPGYSMHLTFIQVPIPWFQMFTSPAMWGILVAYFCNNYGFYTLLTTLPTYLHDVLNIKSKVRLVLYLYTVHVLIYK